MTNVVERVFRGGIRRAAHLLEVRATVLAYHSVGDVESDPFALFVSPSNFSEHIAVLKRSFSVVGVTELVSMIESRKLKRKAIAVTFDDGYCGALNNGCALLASHSLSSALFLASEPIDSRNEYWWDQLEQLFLLPGDLPERLDIQIAGSRFEADLGQWATLSCEAALEHRQWLANSGAYPTVRHLLFRRAYDLLRPLPGAERAAALEALWGWAERKPCVRASHAIVNSDDVRQLADSRFIEAGGHTATHPVLSALELAEQKREVCAGKSRVEEMLGRSMATFAYPYGGGADYTTDSMRIVREAGYAAAFTTQSGPATNRSDLFAIPRRTVKNWSGRAFEAWLRQWMQ